jgi:DNA-binding CsgD family transcriptional regulator
MLTDPTQIQSGESGAILAAFCALSIALNRLLEQVLPEDYQRSAMLAVSKALGIDSALWGVASMSQDGPVPQALHLFNQPLEMMQNWERIKRQDTLFQFSFERQGTAVLADSSGPFGGPPFSDEIRDHVRRFGMAHMVTIVFVDPLTRLISAISMYRSNPDRPFQEHERLLTEGVCKLLTDCWSRCRLNAVASDRPLRLRAPRALADSANLLHAASPEFVELLRQEFPHWQGSVLPQVFANGTASFAVGERLVASKRSSGALWVLELRSRNLQDALSPRELEVATLISQGFDHRQIAAKLNLAPDTVRNHTKNIYARTGVHGKLELTRLLAG